MGVSRKLAWLCALLLAASVATGAAALGIRPEIHLTFYLEEEGKPWMMVEAPAILPASWLEALARKLHEADAPAEGQTPPVTVEPSRPVTTNRDGKEFLSVRIPFDSVADMEEVLTGAVFPELLDQKAFSSLFQSFSYTVTKSGLTTTYELRAQTDADTAGLLATISRISYHVQMPGRIVESNAPQTELGLPTWELQSGQPPELHVISEETVLATAKGKKNVWPVAGAVAGGLVVVGLAVLAAIKLWPRPKPARRFDPEGEEPLQGKHGDWDQAMQDVDGVHTSDYDGSAAAPGADSKPLDY